MQVLWLVHRTAGLVLTLGWLHVLSGGFIVSLVELLTVEVVFLLRQCLS